MVSINCQERHLAPELLNFSPYSFCHLQPCAQYIFAGMSGNNNEVIRCERKAMSWKTLECSIKSWVTISHSQGHLIQASSFKMWELQIRKCSLKWIKMSCFYEQMTDCLFVKPPLVGAVGHLVVSVLNKLKFHFISFCSHHLCSWQQSRARWSKLRQWAYSCHFLSQIIASIRFTVSTIVSITICFLSLTFADNVTIWQLLKVF